jgi:hypothetical protein
MNKTITMRVCVDDESAEAVAQDFREELSGQTDEPITAHYSAEFLAKHAVTIDDGCLCKCQAADRISVDV